MRFLSRRISGDSLLSDVALTKASMPPLNSIVRIAAADRRSRTGPSTSDRTEIVCTLGMKRRLVLMLEWLTLWPTWTPLPVTGHLRAMRHLVQQSGNKTHRAAASSRAAAAFYAAPRPRSSAALVPASGPQHQRDDRQHDRHLDQHADDGRQRR